MDFAAAERAATLTGVAMVVTSAILLSAKGLLAKILYAQGIDYQTVVALRAALAVPGFVLVALAFGGVAKLRSATWRQWLGAAFAGVLTYYLGAGVNFYALTIVDASVERALLFSYPALVVLANWAITRRRPSGTVLIAVATTYLGIALTVGVFSAGIDRSDLIGSLLVMFSAATIAVYFLLSGRLTRSMGSAQFTLVAMTAAALALALHYQISHGWQHLTLEPQAWSWMLLLVVVVTVLPLYLVAEGVRRIGAARGAIASTVGPPAAAVLAVLFLGEQLSLARIIGIALIIGGIVAVERSQR